MKKIFYAVLGSIIFYGCASISSPNGGPKDTTPPKLLSSNPDSAQTNFTGNKIVLTFDEYFTTNNINSQLIISPPLNNPPTVKINKQSLIITYKDTLKANTTYSFNFGESIKDLNEGNTLENFSVIFSTGNTIDSLTQIGLVTDAVTGEPLESAIKVYLYKTAGDSDLFLERPYYITKTDESGRFKFKHISGDSFTIYAHEDVNNNYRFEELEKIGFIKDRIYPDSNPIQLELGTDKRIEPLKILRSQLQSDASVLVLFNQLVPWYTIFHVESSASGSDKRQSLAYHNSRDSLIIYPSTQDFQGDTLELLITNGDSVFFQKISINELRIPQFSLTTAGVVKPDTSLIISSSTAVKKYNSDFVQLFKDSVEITSLSLRAKTPTKTELATPLASNSNYKLVLKPGAFTDIHNKVNELDTISFSTRNVEDLGSFIITMQLDSSNTKPVIVELLLDGKEQVLRTDYITSSQNISYNNLNPGKYKVRAFIDQNANGYWDSHDLINKKIAEKYYHFSKEVEVRKNWEIKNLIFSVP